MKNSFFWEGRIWIKKIILNLQIFSWFGVLFKIWIKMIKKINPVVKISLHKAEIKGGSDQTFKFYNEYKYECWKYTLSKSQKKPFRVSSIFSSGTAVTLLIKSLIFGGWKKHHKKTTLNSIFIFFNNNDNNKIDQYSYTSTRRLSGHIKTCLKNSLIVIVRINAEWKA